MSGFIDIHHHFLYGVDDGAENKIEMQKMLVDAHRDGIRKMIATPHITPGIIPYSLELLEMQVEEARTFIQSFGIDLEILLGAEVMHTFQTQRFLSEHLIPSLGGTDKILLELASNAAYFEIEDAILAVLRAGYLPILAHIERYDCLMNARHRLVDLKKEYDVFYQVNADCILRGRDYVTNKTIKRSIQEGIVDYVATDAHNVHRRGTNMKNVYSKMSELYGQDTANRLTGNDSSIYDFLGKR